MKVMEYSRIVTFDQGRPEIAPYENKGTGFSGLAPENSAVVQSSAVGFAGDPESF
jgi:hypothetical protein